jgi:hypothetical protein
MEEIKEGDVVVLKDKKGILKGKKEVKYHVILRSYTSLFATALIIRNCWEILPLSRTTSNRY